MTSSLRSQVAGTLLAVVLTVVVATALFLLGAPAEERSRRLDERRVEDLATLSGTLDVFWTRHQRLPASLEQLAQELGTGSVPADPASGAPYEYRAVASQTFEVCAVFDAESQDLTSAPANRLWLHGGGRQCFRRDTKRID